MILVFGFRISPKKYGAERENLCFAFDFLTSQTEIGSRQSQGEMGAKQREIIRHRNQPMWLTRVDIAEASQMSSIHSSCSQDPLSIQPASGHLAICPLPCLGQLMKRTAGACRNFILAFPMRDYSIFNNAKAAQAEPGHLQPGRPSPQPLESSCLEVGALDPTSGLYASGGYF